MTTSTNFPKSSGGKVYIGPHGKALKKACCAAQPCPVDCSACADCYLVSISGFVGNCGMLNHSFIVIRSGCTWYPFSGSVVLSCSNSHWVLSIDCTYVGGGIISGSIANTTGCPLGTYSLTCSTGGTGTAVVTTIGCGNLCSSIDCSSCPANLSVTVSSGDPFVVCPGGGTATCNALDKTIPVSKIFDCLWFGFINPGPIEAIIECTGGSNTFWTLEVRDGSVGSTCGAIFIMPNTGLCPPLGSWYYAAACNPCLYAGSVSL